MLLPLSCSRTNKTSFLFIVYISKHKDTKPKLQDISRNKLLAQSYTVSNTSRLSIAIYKMTLYCCCRIFTLTSLLCEICSLYKKTICGLALLSNNIPGTKSLTSDQPGWTITIKLMRAGAQCQQSALTH